ncbi:MAG: isocitrate/isopropylmalate dehydrogenase family protein [Bacillota bacterium]
MLGDGIGPEVVPASVRAIQATPGVRRGDVVIEWVHLPVGWQSYRESGQTLPESTLEELVGLDGWILGPIGHMDYPRDDPGAVNPHPIIRKRFSLHSNIRPARSHSAIDSIHQDVDLVIIRENNEGFQPDRNMFRGWGEFMPSPDMVLSSRVITRANSEFVARTAFELARQRDAGKRVTVVHKSTVFKMGCGLFAECCRDVSRDYPDVQCDEIIVDTFAMRLVMRPQEFDVVVTTNMFGDILSDEAAGLVGGLGMAPGLCVGPRYAMAQATHGSAPDIAGEGIANPYAMIVSAGMLISWLGHRADDSTAVESGEAVVWAVDEVVAAGDSVTPDLGGSSRTGEMAEAVIERLVASN